jgi:hypothetical protein
LPFRASDFPRNFYNPGRPALKTGLPLPENHLLTRLPIYLGSNLASAYWVLLFANSPVFKGLNELLCFFLPPLSTDSHLIATNIQGNNFC